MARGKKKDSTAAAPAPEATTAPEPTTAPQEPEAHLDPGQLAEMDDATLQGLAQDMGIDPAAYEGRDALIAAIAAVPVIPGPPEPEDPDATPAPEPTAEPEPEQQQDPAPAPEPEATTDPPQEPDPAERPLPYTAKVAVSLAVLHKAVGVGTADMLKAVGTLRHGAAVTVTGRNGPFAQLKNGLWVKESFLEA